MRYMRESGIRIMMIRDRCINLLIAVCDTSLLVTSNHRHPARLPSFPQAWSASALTALAVCSVSVAVSVSVSPPAHAWAWLYTDTNEQRHSGTRTQLQQQQGPHCTNPCPAQSEWSELCEPSSQDCWEKTGKLELLL